MIGTMNWGRTNRVTTHETCDRRPRVISETTIQSTVDRMIEATVAACDVEFKSGPPGSFLQTYRFGPMSQSSSSATTQFESKIDMGGVRFDFFGDYTVGFTSLHFGSAGGSSTFSEWFNGTVNHECQYFVMDDDCNPDYLCDEIVNPLEFCDAYWTCMTGCPLMLDLDSNGFRFGGPESAIRFDLYGDGDPDHLQWVVPGEDDAFLFMDLNGNGIVDDGTELFGNGTRLILENRSASPNGFVALAQFDDPGLGGNDDGEISPSDEIWETLALWLDGNANSQCEPNEVIRIDSVGLESIAFVPRESDLVDIHGNALRFFSSAYGADERHIAVVDVFFKRKLRRKSLSLAASISAGWNCQDRRRLGTLWRPRRSRASTFRRMPGAVKA